MEIRGDQAVIAKLRELEDKVARDYLKTSLRTGAVPIKDAAYADAPKRTGVLASQIKVRNGRSRKGLVSVLVSVGRKQMKGPGYYARYVDQGHFTGKRPAGKFRGRNAKEDYRRASIAAGRKWVEGRFFMQHGLDAAGEEAIAVAKQTLLDLINKDVK